MQRKADGHGHSRARGGGAEGRGFCQEAPARLIGYGFENCTDQERGE